MWKEGVRRGREIAKINEGRKERISEATSR